MFKSPLRMFIGAPVAAVITVGIFLLMGDLIKSGEIPTEVPERPEIPDITMPKTINPPDDPVDPTPKPPVITPPPVAPIDDWGTDGPVNTGPTPTVPKGPEEKFPLPQVRPNVSIRMPPEYPQSCLNSGTEGYAIVQFDITPNGQVVNAVVVDSSNRCFERASIRAIQKWKFTPPVDANGKATTQRGLVETFRFRLTD